MYVLKYNLITEIKVLVKRHWDKHVYTYMTITQIFYPKQLI